MAEEEATAAASTSPSVTAPASASATASAEEGPGESSPEKEDVVKGDHTEAKPDQTDTKAAPEPEAKQSKEQAAEPPKTKSDGLVIDVAPEERGDREMSFDETMKTVESAEGKTADEDAGGRRKSRQGSKLRSSLHRDEKKITKSAMSLGEKRADSGIRTGAEETRKSRGRNALGSIIDIRRSSAVGEVFDRKVARYMNTFKLESDNPFNPEKVDKILESVMMEALENLTYDIEKCSKQAKWASMAIKAKVKGLEFDRYKIISVVTIGEKHSQDVFVTCRFLWDAEKDRYSTFSMENTYVFGIAQCFGLYYE